MKIGDWLSLLTHLAGIVLAAVGLSNGNHELATFGVGLAGGTGLSAHLPVSMFGGSVQGTVDVDVAPAPAAAPAAADQHTH